jgi:hypothetical protein
VSATSTDLPLLEQKKLMVNFTDSLCCFISVFGSTLIAITTKAATKKKKTC